MDICFFYDVGLFVKCFMLNFVVNVGELWFGVVGVLLDVLFVGVVIIGLKGVNVSIC